MRWAFNYRKFNLDITFTLIAIWWIVFDYTRIELIFDIRENVGILHVAIIGMTIFENCQN